MDDEDDWDLDADEHDTGMEGEDEPPDRAHGDTEGTTARPLAELLADENLRDFILNSDVTSSGMSL